MANPLQPDAADPDAGLPLDERIARAELAVQMRDERVRRHAQAFEHRTTEQAGRWLKNAAVTVAAGVGIWLLSAVASRLFGRSRPRQRATSRYYHPGYYEAPPARHRGRDWLGIAALIAPFVLGAPRNAAAATPTALLAGALMPWLERWLARSRKRGGPGSRASGAPYTPHSTQSTYTQHTPPRTRETRPSGEAQAPSREATWRDASARPAASSTDTEAADALPPLRTEV